MSILLLGSTSMLGSYIKSYFGPEVIPLGRKQLPFVLQYMEGIKVVINCVCLKENEKGDHFLINAFLPQDLSNLCSKLHVKLIHISTDAVFKDGLCDENTICDPEGDYASSKYFGDELIKDRHMIIRTSLIGEAHNGKGLVEWLKDNRYKEVDGYCSLWNGITCLELVKLLKIIIDKNLFWYGVRHVTSPLPISKYDLLQLINKEYDLGIKINMDTTYRQKPLLKSLYHPLYILPIEDQVREMKEFCVHN